MTVLWASSKITPACREALLQLSVRPPLQALLQPGSRMCTSVSVDIDVAYGDLLFCATASTLVLGSGSVVPTLVLLVSSPEVSAVVTKNTAACIAAGMLSGACTSTQASVRKRKRGPGQFYGEIRTGECDQ